jgi:hypothetical protein
MAEHKCLYCEQWIKSPQVFRNADGDKKKSKVVIRTCPIKKKKIQSDDPSCKYFIPADHIYCIKNSERIHMLNCLQRRLLRDKYTAWKKCKKCRQFEMDVRPIIEDYHIGLERIVRKEEKSLKRRRKNNPGKESDRRVLKRRNPKSNPRKLKRRKTIEAEKKVRKLKRRRK